VSGAAEATHATVQRTQPARTRRHRPGRGRQVEQGDRRRDRPGARHGKVLPRNHPPQDGHGKPRRDGELVERPQGPGL